VAIIALSAFLAEQLIWRSDAVLELGRSHIVEVAERLVYWEEAGTTRSPSWLKEGSGLKRGAVTAAEPGDPVNAITGDGRVVCRDGEHGQSASGKSVSVSHRNGGGAAGNVRLSLTMNWQPRLSCFGVAVDPSRGIRIAEVTELPYGTGTS